MKKIFIPGVLLLLFACTDLHKGEYLDDIEKLETVLTEIEDQTEEIDTLALQEMFEVYTVVNDQVKQIKDTLDLETALILDSYLKAMRKIDCVRIDLVVVKDNVEMEKATLGKLREDIQNAYGRRNKYNDYIKSEELRVDSINNIFNDVQTDYAMITEVFNENNAELRNRLNTFTLSE